MNPFTDDYVLTDEIPDWVKDSFSGARKGTVSASTSIVDRLLHQWTGTADKNILAGYDNSTIVVFGLLAYVVLCK